MDTYGVYFLMFRLFKELFQNKMYPFPPFYIFKAIVFFCCAVRLEVLHAILSFDFESTTVIGLDTVYACEWYGATSCECHNILL